MSLCVYVTERKTKQRTRRWINKRIDKSIQRKIVGNDTMEREQE